jgi:hypothetical protein
MTSNYKGDGGIHKMLVGVGFAPFKGLALVFNAGYLWGGYDRSVTLSGSTTMNTLYKSYQADVSSYVLDFGLQYDLKLSKTDALTVGLTYGLGHKLNADAECDIINQNSTTSKKDTTSLVAANALELPHTFGAGLAYKAR